MLLSEFQGLRRCPKEFLDEENSKTTKLERQLPEFFDKTRFLDSKASAFRCVLDLRGLGIFSGSEIFFNDSRDFRDEYQSSLLPDKTTPSPEESQQ